MKFLGKLILWLLIALLVVIIAAYFLLQTQWGGRQASARVNPANGSRHDNAIAPSSVEALPPASTNWRMRLKVPALRFSVMGGITTFA